MARLKFFLAAFIICLTVLQSYAQDARQPGNNTTTVSLLTCGPGNELYSVFGHTAIRVKNISQGFDVVFNYGTFDFDTPNFYLKFVKGDLKYFVSVSAFQDFLYTYQYYDRDVFEQVLNLSPVQKQYIAEELNNSLLPENREYTYKFIDRNCTTMVADIINKHIDGKISLQNSDSGKTNRTIIYENLDNKFYENLGINLIFGHRTDVPMYKLFLPKQLLEGVSNTTMPNGKALAQPVTTIYKSTTNQEKAAWWNNFYTYAIACLLLMVGSRYALLRNTLLAILGLIGFFFCFVGYYSYHAEITQNYNALLFNPLFLVLLYYSLFKKYKYAKVVGSICLLLVILYVIIMLSKPYLLMVLPLIALVIVVIFASIWPKQLKTVELYRK
ncbi:DUF4105 domain-containing protein [Flavobacterium rhizosphaerae]|uniref:DUF4105 domain-containing protein n=1 Tax=Flavobacterium rhizosphaerae TaxID=3163298 RepID=A0ABW8YYB8_9FLAO